MQPMRRAFSLIEVLAALVILSMCIAVVMPTWLKIRSAQHNLQPRILAQDAAHQLDQEALSHLIERYSITDELYRYSIEYLESYESADQFGQWILIHVSEQANPDHILASELRLLYREPETEETEAAGQ